MSARKAATRPGLLSVDSRDDAGRCDAAMCDAKRIELALDQCRGLELFET